VTLTLSRYILESSLLDYLFVGHRESLVAAACLLLAMFMNNEGVWVRLWRFITLNIDMVVKSTVVDILCHAVCHARRFVIKVDIQGRFSTAN